MGAALKGSGVDMDGSARDHLEREAEKCRRALEKMPDNVDLLLLTSVIELKLEHPDAAVKRLEEALAVRPFSAELWCRYGELLLLQSRYQDAAGAFDRSTELNPNHPETHHLAGMALVGCGRQPEAVEALKRAVLLRPGFPEALNDLGGILKERGDSARAAACFERAIEAAPHFAPAINNLGLVHYDLGHLDEAAAAFRKVLAFEPDHPEALNNLGTVLSRRNALEEGMACYRQALALRPHYPEALLNLGMALAESGREAEAIETCRRALSIKPDYPEALFKLGSLLEGQGRLPEARVCFERAVAINPRYAIAVNALAGIHFKQGRLDEAAAFYRKAINIDPNFPEALNNLGMVLCRQGAFEESLTCFERSLTLRPDYPEVLMNLGNTLRDAGRLPQAISSLERALSLDGDSPSLHLNLGIFLLAAGRLEEGWNEYEWRWRYEGFAANLRHFAQPRWVGEPAENRVLLLCSEQGFGDTLQFCRYAPLAAARGFRVHLLVQPPLVRLLTSLGGIDQVFGADLELPHFDLQCPLMSLPLVFHTHLGNIPADIPYLAPERDAVAEWRGRLPDNPSRRLKVGLAWAGTSRPYSPVSAAADRERSLSPELLAPLLEVPGTQFFSLQKDRSIVPPELGLIDLMDECRDFADTAALIANLDLVVSVDTAVAHLAGALGKPVLLLVRSACCWRWLRDREDSPWYPTLRLFRQPRPGDWESAIAGVRGELERYAAQVDGLGERNIMA